MAGMITINPLETKVIIASPMTAASCVGSLLGKEMTCHASRTPAQMVRMPAKLPVNAKPIPRMAQIAETRDFIVWTHIRPLARDTKTEGLGPRYLNLLV